MQYAYLIFVADVTDNIRVKNSAKVDSLKLLILFVLMKNLGIGLKSTEYFAINTNLNI